MSVNREGPNIGPRISIYRSNGELVTRLGSGYGLGTGQFIAPHGLSQDSAGNLYVAEVAHTEYSAHGKPPPDIRSLQKLASVS